MITLVGVGHVFDLKAQVRGLIVDKRPQVVCLELDRGRFEAMLDRSFTDSAPFSYRLLSMLQRYIARKYEVQLGEEMLTAAKTARDIGARVAFIDMDAAIFYQKIMASMSFKEKIKMMVSAAGGLFVRKKRIEKELKKYEESEAEYMDIFEKEFPSVKRVLVDERNMHMANAIREVNRDYGDIVVVIGDGHVEGIKKLINDLNPEVIRLKELRDYKDSVELVGESDSNVSVTYSFEISE